MMAQSAWMLDKTSEEGERGEGDENSDDDVCDKLGDWRAAAAAATYK